MKPKKKRLYARHKKLAELRTKEEENQQKTLQENKKIDINIAEQHSDVAVSNIKVEKESEAIVPPVEESPKEEPSIVKVKKNTKTNIIPKSSSEEVAPKPKPVRKRRTKKTEE